MSSAFSPPSHEAADNFLSDIKDVRLRTLSVGSAAQFVHCLLFFQEFAKAGDETRAFDLTPVSFFFERKGGLHLLLLLLNASYHKRSPGRTSGWPFGVLAARVDISRRSLRQLLADAIGEGIVERRCGHHNKRRVVYCATPKLLAAWGLLFDNMSKCITNVFSNLGADRLADIDYRTFDPNVSAQDQAPPPADTLYLKSASHAHLRERQRYQMGWRPGMGSPRRD